MDDAKIEICCTAHTSPSIRRLVKSVIRGLKACQVCVLLLLLLVTSQAPWHVCDIVNGERKR